MTAKALDMLSILKAKAEIRDLEYQLARAKAFLAWLEAGQPDPEPSRYIWATPKVHSR